MVIPCRGVGNKDTYSNALHFTNAMFDYKSYFTKQFNGFSNN